MALFTTYISPTLLESRFGVVDSSKLGLLVLYEYLEHFEFVDYWQKVLYSMHKSYVLGSVYERRTDGNPRILYHKAQ